MIVGSARRPVALVTQSSDYLERDAAQPTQTGGPARQNSTLASGSGRRSALARSITTIFHRVEADSSRVRRA